MKTQEELNERILEDDYPVYPSYAYVCDGKVRSSPIQGTVKTLKREFKCTEIKNCDLAGRGLM